MSQDKEILKDVAHLLHEHINQHIVAVITEAAILKEKCKINNPDLMKHAHTIHTAANHIYNAAKDFSSHQLWPTQIESLGLKDALLSLIQRWEITQNAVCNIKFSGQFEHVDDALCVAIYGLIKSYLFAISNLNKNNSPDIYIEHASKPEKCLINIAINSEGYAIHDYQDQLATYIERLKAYVTSKDGTFTIDGNINDEASEKLMLVIEIPDK